MQQESFNYRNQLIAIVHSLQEAVGEIYVHAFELALYGELRVMNDILEDGDRLPADINYIKTLKSPVITSLAELIEDILILQESIFNVNALTAEEVVLPEAEAEEKMAIYLPHPESAPAWLAAEMCTFECLLDLYVLVWQLANSTLEEPQEVIMQFKLGYYVEKFCLPSQDANVVMILDALNSILDKNRLIDYWSAKDECQE